MLEPTCELIALLRPRAYLIGNVPGLQDSTSWHAVQEHIGGLARHGYCVADYAQLDAADYGVPQHRVRPFWFGHLAGPCIRWPAPTHGAPTTELAIPGCGLKPWVTCRDALSHLPLKDLGRPVRMIIRPPRLGGGKNGGDESRCSSPDGVAKTVVAGEARKGGQILITQTGNHRPTTPDEPAKTLTKNTHSDGCLLHFAEGHPPAQPSAPAPTIRGGGDGHSAPYVVLTANDKHPINEPDSPSMTVTCKGDGRGAQGAAALSWPWDRPATTIVGDERLSAPGRHGPAVSNSQHGHNAVVLSEKDAAILQGFPEDWVFSGKTKKARWAQIGMAMPPGLAEPVARAVVAQMAATGEVAA